MSAEITLQIALSFRKGGAMDGIDPGPILVTMTGTRFLHARQLIGTSEEALVLGEVPTGGACMIWNRDQTHFVTVRRASGQLATLRIPPGLPAVFCFDGTDAAAPTLKADTAAVEVEYLILET